MKYPRLFLLLLALAVLGGCANVPAGPSVMVLPTAGKSFDAFQKDDYDCRQWAAQQVRATPGQTYNESLGNGAALGTLVGAGLGVAIGAASGNAGAGAAIGGASGLLLGTSVAQGPATAAAWEVQRRYDIAYQQCMYLKGNQIPGLVRSARRTPSIPPPPPPPGYPPEPPVYPSGKNVTTGTPGGVPASPPPPLP